MEPRRSRSFDYEKQVLHVVLAVENLTCSLQDKPADMLTEST